MNNNLTFIDLFAGIGGFHLALSNVGMSCVFSSEIDKHARNTYLHNFPHISEENFVGDITTYPIENIPEFDVLCAGFPCQPFSNAGKKEGFNDKRGNHFFLIEEIIKQKQPQAFFLENVRNLTKHDNGKTFNVIKERLEYLGYSFFYKVVKATDFNCPQYRPRIYMVGFKDKSIEFEFPSPIALTKNMSDILGGKCNREIGYTLRVGGKNSPIDDRRNWDGYIVDGNVVRLSVEQAKQMQGFPEHFNFLVSQSQAMKQLGNSVAIPVVEAIAKKISLALKN